MSSAGDVAPARTIRPGSLSQQASLLLPIIARLTCVISHRPTVPSTRGDQAGREQTAMGCLVLCSLCRPGNDHNLVMVGPQRIREASGILLIGKGPDVHNEQLPRLEDVRFEPVPRQQLDEGVGIL